MPPPGPRGQQPSRAALTHFLCIPLGTVAAGRRQLADSLAAFRADVAGTTVAMAAGGETQRGMLPTTALRPVGTLHLTLGVMSLDAERLQQAVETLQSLRRDGQVDSEGADRHILIALRGLHAIQPPAQARVLYAAPVDEASGQESGGALLQLCERARAAFADLLVGGGKDPLLLHATVVNTIYVKGRGSGGRGRGGGGGRGRGRGGRGGRERDRMTFDAQELLDRYEGHVWMEHVPIETVALCRMGAETVVDDEGVVDAAYPVVAEVPV